jgi:hypothetical protein
MKKKGRCEFSRIVLGTLNNGFFLGWASASLLALLTGCSSPSAISHARAPARSDTQAIKPTGKPPHPIFLERPAVELMLKAPWDRLFKESRAELAKGAQGAKVELESDTSTPNKAGKLSVSRY